MRSQRQVSAGRTAAGFLVTALLLLGAAQATGCARYEGLHASVAGGGYLVQPVTARADGGATVRYDAVRQTGVVTAGVDLPPDPAE